MERSPEPGRFRCGRNIGSKPVRMVVWRCANCGRLYLNARGPASEVEL